MRGLPKPACSNEQRVASNSSALFGTVVTPYCHFMTGTPNLKCRILTAAGSLLRQPSVAGCFPNSPERTYAQLGKPVRHMENSLPEQRPQSCTRLRLRSMPEAYCTPLEK